MQGVLLPMLHGLHLHPFAQYRETDFGGIAQGITQGIGEAVGAFLVNHHQPPVSVRGVKHAQVVARVDEGFHVLSVGPGVDVAVFFIAEAAYHAAEDLLAIHFQHHGMYSIAVGDALHVVVCPYADAHQSPSRDRFLRLQREGLGLLAAIHHTFAALGEEHDALCAGSRMVAHILLEEG